MAMYDIEMLENQRRSNWLRLRTLVIIRWIAILGQVIAVTVATTIYQLQFPVWAATFAIAISAFVNTIATFNYSGNRRLSGREATLVLLFDMFQLGILLFLTGGLNNPFALYVLAPVTISATVLRLRSAIVLGSFAVLMVSCLALWGIPVSTSTGEILALPRIFLFGFWLALVTGILFISIYSRQVTSELNSMSDALVATQLALEREQTLTDLDGIVAATAHELGTPLATIKLVSHEMIDELTEDETLFDDAALIGKQADRCHGILKTMGQVGREDLHLQYAPAEAIIQKAADPHMNRGKEISINILSGDGASPSQPYIARRSEIVHGLRNFIQNAVDFSDSRVDIDLSWSETLITVVVRDDGSGFSPSILSRIGEPFVRRQRTFANSKSRPEYEGMGLGLFIAKTLLERTGANLTFQNGGTKKDPKGAIIRTEWPREVIERPLDTDPNVKFIP